FNYVFSEGQDYAQRVDHHNVIGENYISLLPEKYQSDVKAELQKVLNGFPRSFEVVTNNSTYIMSAVPLYDDEKIDRLLLVEKNISEQKQAEQDMVAALNKERELNELKSRFVSMASHEFRTPLATILSSVNLVNRYAENNNTDGVAKHVGRIRNSVRNLTSILNDFLSLEKLEQGKVAFTPEPFSVCELSRSVTEDMGEMTKSGQVIELRCCPNKEACTQGLVNGLDPQLIRNILFNLLSNAIKYSKENSTVTLKIAIENELTISVEDQGIGIPEKEQQHLFERFFRAKNATNIQGTGLGLNIVQKHVDLMGGTINFESVIDQGTTFTISLPIE
ncbi:MAG: ATP-binding protein, partial [Flavobacteriales bacterium]